MTLVLDANTKQKVTYCVPNWVRDDNIRKAIAKVSGRFTPQPKRDEPIAIAGFGPSLNDTWEQIRDYKYVMSCSGSHKFLIERGIVPTYHVEVDPRPHKIDLLGQPHPDVEYLAASACHPAYFDHLAGYNVKIWHVYDPSDEGLRTLPHGDYAVTGGCDVGLRCLTLAACLGFRDLHIFGLDGSAKSGDTARHAAEHPNGKQKYATTEYNGKTYFTTPAMLEAARQTRHEMQQMPAVKATFYGEGLTQAMMADYQPAGDKGSNQVAITKPELISAEYRELNKKLHEANLAYGVGGGKHAKTVIELCVKLKTKNVLDYGCGKGLLAKEIPWQIAEYDPCVPGKEESPKAADLVICTDVLEHIEPDKLHWVLEDLKRVVRQVGYFVIHTGPAQKTLPDGRNTHLIQRGKDWWRTKLRKCFFVARIFTVGQELVIVVAPKQKKKAKAA